MKKSLVFGVLVLLALPLMPAGCQNANTTTGEGSVEVSEGVLRTAKWMKFDYNGNLEKIKRNDNKALMDFLDFHAAVDGIDGINHGVTCLELIPVVGDNSFAEVLVILKPNLRKLVFDRLVLAQGRTKKEELRKPLSEWAPATWAALNNKPIPANTNFRKIDPETGTPAPGKDAAPAATPADAGKREGGN
jgi:hypothetical protein